MRRINIWMPIHKKLCVGTAEVALYKTKKVISEDQSS